MNLKTIISTGLLVLFLVIFNNAPRTFLTLNTSWINVIGKLGVRSCLDSYTGLSMLVFGITCPIFP